MHSSFTELDLCDEKVVCKYATNSSLLHFRSRLPFIACRGFITLSACIFISLAARREMSPRKKSTHLLRTVGEKEMF